MTKLHPQVDYSVLVAEDLSRILQSDYALTQRMRKLLGSEQNRCLAVA